MQIKFQQLYLLAEGLSPNRMQCTLKLSEAWAVRSSDRQSLTPEGKEGIGKTKDYASPQPFLKPVLCPALGCCSFLAYQPTPFACDGPIFTVFHMLGSLGQAGHKWSLTLAILHEPNQLCDCLMCHLTQREALTLPL